MRACAVIVAVTIVAAAGGQYTDESELLAAVGAYTSGTHSQPPIGDWDVSAVTDMYGLFQSASSFNGDVSDWDVSSVTTMHNMFRGAGSFNGDISGWDVARVTNVQSMFQNAWSFSCDLGSWDVGSVAHMLSMFYQADGFNGDISGWDVSSVESMHGMFFGATRFNGDISGWDVRNVGNMRKQFGQASIFNGDISGWDVGNVVDMKNMFTATSFNGDISGWDVRNVTDMDKMFKDATNFSGNLTGWNVSSGCSRFEFINGATSFNEACSPFYLGQDPCPIASTPTMSPTKSPTPTFQTVAPAAMPTTSTNSDPTAVAAPSAMPTSFNPTISPTRSASESIKAATATLSADMAHLSAVLVGGAAAEPKEVAGVLAVAANSVSGWLTEVAEAGSGASEEALPEELEAFGLAQEMLSNLTLLAAASLNASVVSQGASADGTVVLTSAHATLDSDKLAYPFFAPGFTGAAACLEIELSAAAAASPRLCASMGAGVSGDRNAMTLPVPRDIGVTGRSAFVGFSEFASPRVTGSVWSKVLSATVAGVAHNTPFNNAAKMRFNLTAATETASRVDDSNPCVFWDEQLLNWSSTGCEHLGTVGGLVVMCECNHLTSFAVLTDANSATRVDNGLSENEQHNLTWFVFVCVGISIGCLTVVILVYAVASELRTEAKVILLHLCIVYNLALILFLATATGTFDGDECIAVGAALHFALLSTFLWMLAEGHHLHQTFVNVFSQRRTQEGRQIAVYCSVAYGGPAIEVLLLGFLWPAGYERDDGLCFLSKRKGAIWFFLGPALTIIAFNVYVLVLVSREVWNLHVLDGSDSRTAEIITKTRRAFKSSLAFGSILGITWVFGLLSLVVPDSVAFHYIFALCNALGGLWIFGFHLLKDPEVCKRARASSLGAMLGSSNGKKKPHKNRVVRRAKGPLKFNGAWGWGGAGTGTDGTSDGLRQPDSRPSLASAENAQASLAGVKPPSSPNPPQNGNDNVDCDSTGRLVSDVGARNGYVDVRMAFEGDNAAVRPSSSRTAPGSVKLPEAKRLDVNPALQPPTVQKGDRTASTKPLKLRKDTLEGTYSAGSARTEENDDPLGFAPEKHDYDNDSLASAPDEETDCSLGSAPEENAGSMWPAAEEKDSSSPPPVPRTPTEADHVAMTLPVYVPPPSGEEPDDPENPVQLRTDTMVTGEKENTKSEKERERERERERARKGKRQTLWDPAEAASTGEAIRRSNAALHAVISAAAPEGDASRHSAAMSLPVYAPPSSEEEPGDPENPERLRTDTMATLWDPAEAASAGEAIQRYNAALHAVASAEAPEDPDDASRRSAPAGSTMP